MGEQDAFLRTLDEGAETIFRNTVRTGEPDRLLEASLRAAGLLKEIEMDKPTVFVVKGNVDMPKYQTHGASGLDLCAAEDGHVPSRSQATIGTGLKIAIPPGYEAQVRPRSGLAAKEGIFAILGTIDSDYRGEVKVILANNTNNLFPIVKGMRIAQLVICPVIQANLVPVIELDKTARGEGGFGSTGR